MDAETKQAFAEMMRELKEFRAESNTCLHKLEQGQEQLAQNTATILNAITVYSQVEQAHYEEVSGKITQLSEKQEEMEKIQNQHSIDIMQLRAAQ